MNNFINQDDGATLNQENYKSPNIIAHTEPSLCRPEVLAYTSWVLFPREWFFFFTSYSHMRIE